MPAEIPAPHRDLLTKKTFAHLATIMKDGSPQVTPVWFDTDGPYIRVNSAVGRLKDKNMRGAIPTSRCRSSIPTTPTATSRSAAASSTSPKEGGAAHIDGLAKKYMGLDTYPMHQPGVARVIYKIEPLRFSTMG